MSAKTPNATTVAAMNENAVAFATVEALMADLNDDETVITIRVPATITRKLAGHTFTFPVKDIPQESLGAIFAYGFRLPADAANTAAKSWRDANGHEKGVTWDRNQSEAFFAAVMDGTIAERAARAAGTSTDPVRTLARRMAMTDVMNRLNMTWKEAAADPRGKAYVITTDKTIRPNPETLDAYIVRAAEAGVDYMQRAETELSLTNAAVNLEVEL